MCVHRVWCSIDLGSRAPSWFTVPTGTTLSTPFYHMMLPQSVTRFACFAAHASQCVHKRRQYAYKAVHALMCFFAPLRSESVRTTKIFRDGFADPELFFTMSHTPLFSVIEAFLVHANQFVRRRRQDAYRAVHVLMWSWLRDAVNHPKNHPGRLCRPRSFTPTKLSF